MEEAKVQWLQQLSRFQGKDYVYADRAHCSSHLACPSPTEFSGAAGLWLHGANFVDDEEFSNRAASCDGCSKPNGILLSPSYGAIAPRVVELVSE
jgi:hypothetical protein